MDADTLKKSSGKKIAEYIQANIHNEATLTQLFDSFEAAGKSLTPEILTLKITTGIEVINFLGYAIRYSFFPKIIELSSEQAINFALSEPPANAENGMTLHYILLCLYEKEALTDAQVESVVALIKKASQKVISTILIESCFEITPFFLAMTLKYEAIFCALINKADPEAVNQAVRLGLNVYVLGELTDENMHESMHALQGQLAQEQIDFLMLQRYLPEWNGNILAKLMVFYQQQPDPEMLHAHYLLFSKMSLEALRQLFTQPIGEINGISIGLFHALVYFKHGQPLIKFILCRFESELGFINNLALNEKKANIPFLWFKLNDNGRNHTNINLESATCIIDCLSAKTLWDGMAQPLNREDFVHDLSPQEFLQLESLFTGAPEKRRTYILAALSIHYPLLFNVIVKKILLATEFPLKLPQSCIRKLDEFNRNRYLVQPSMADIEIEHSLIEQMAKLTFQTAQSKAEAFLEQEVEVPLRAYYLLKNNFIGLSPAQIVLDYFLLEDPVVKERVGIEIDRRNKIMPAIPGILNRFYLPSFSKKPKNTHTLGIKQLLEHWGKALEVKPMN